MTAQDPFDLQRFIAAQASIFESALEELTAGRKRSHWMWFIFPQLRGLGLSSTSQFYGIASLEEAHAYLKHPVLGPRLELCTRAVLRSRERSLREIFGSPDDVKFLSSMTLFAIAEPAKESPFQLALDHWSGGLMDERTLRLIKSEAGHSRATRRDSDPV
jgi:uncharacterized protein (DUF1810 family)